MKDAKDWVTLALIAVGLYIGYEIVSGISDAAQATKNAGSGAVDSVKHALGLPNQQDTQALVSAATDQNVAGAMLGFAGATGSKSGAGLSPDNQVELTHNDVESDS